MSGELIKIKWELGNEVLRRSFFLSAVNLTLQNPWISVLNLNDRIHYFDIKMYIRFCYREKMITASGNIHIVHLFSF